MSSQKDQILESLRKATKLPESEIQLEFPENEEFGDYSSNIAMAIFSNFQFPISNFQSNFKFPNSKFKTAHDLALEIVEKLKTDKSLAKVVDKIEVAGPGFINFWLSREALVGQLERAVREKDRYGASNLGKGKTVVIDYSSPNIAKRFGIGHLRSTVIGQALYNLYKFLGYKVIGDNHLGDWGTQFGTLLFQINNQHLTVNKLTIDRLEEIYVDFNKKAEEKPELWDEARAHFKKLEEGDKEARKMWQAIVDISMAEFERIYKILGVKIDYAYGESFYEDEMPGVIELLKEKGISKKSQGAEIVEFAPPAGGLPPAMVVKSDGTTTYLTRDLATIRFRLSQWNPDIIIYEVGSDQTLHFRQLFAIAEMLSWAKGRKFVHVAHGLIRFGHGKMS
ncbi:arginine--tRNA ligase, partial [Candidatus Woesebacteria bacterium]|nr:arginine--tRNA ligase [Candidatus Woesebacteria bacterium]